MDIYKEVARIVGAPRSFVKECVLTGASEHKVITETFLRIKKKQEERLSKLEDTLITLTSDKGFYQAVCELESITKLRLKSIIRRFLVRYNSEVRKDDAKVLDLAEMACEHYLEEFKDKIHKESFSDSNLCNKTRNKIRGREVDMIIIDDPLLSSEEYILNSMKSRCNEKSSGVTVRHKINEHTDIDDLIRMEFSFSDSEKRLKETINKRINNEETTMPTFETVNKVNGNDVTNLSNEQLFNAIAQLEEQIAKLLAIKTKSTAKDRTVSKLQKDIESIVAIVDGREA